ncbi:MAG: Multidrug resistance protein MdtE precursor [Pseudomonadota bacterium]|jgi:membrane fusion protein (multidrug efflux system)
MASKFAYPIVAAVGIAAVSGAAWWYQNQPQQPKEAGAAPASGLPAPATAGAGGAAGGPARPAGVEVAKVEKATLRDDAQAVGTLRSRQNVMLRPEVPGRVRALGFSDGARVRRGQVLVQLDDALQRAEVRQSMAQVSIAKANFKRNQELVAENFVAKRVLDESAAALEVAEAQGALSCARLARMVVLAPFDGVVGLRNVNVGDFVKDGADLINLEDTSSMLVDFRLPERYQGKLKPQQMVEMAIDAFPGRSFKAQIQAIDPLLDANGRSVGVRAVLPNSMGEAAMAGKKPGVPGADAAGKAMPAAGSSAAPGPTPKVAAKPKRPLADASAAGDAAPRLTVEPSPCPASPAVPAGVAIVGGKPLGGPAPLRPGMFARVTTVFSVNDSALVVPEEAIVPQGGKQFVFKVVTPSEVSGLDASKLPPETQFVSMRQEVKLGVRRQGKVEITEGLQEEQTIVIAGQQRLQRDGTALRIVELGRPQGGAANAGASNPTGAAGAASTPAGGAAPAAAPGR